MNLDQYVKYKKKQLKKFEQEWLDNNDQDADNFPLEQERENWDEQFLFYDDEEENETEGDLDE
jgi:hypothetical protein